LCALLVHIRITGSKERQSDAESYGEGDFEMTSATGQKRRHTAHAVVQSLVTFIKLRTCALMILPVAGHKSQHTKLKESDNKVYSFLSTMTSGRHIRPIAK
jgi:hypothetical protein